jgi:thiamine-phosphate pyrophosphorylase
VSDRRSLAPLGPGSVEALENKMDQVALAGVDWIQLREKDLPARILQNLTRRAVQSESKSAKIIVNDRLDVALAEGASGVHLGESSLPVREARKLAPEGFLLGASTHSLEQAQAAAREGADYLFFGPVFATPAKARFGSPQGFERLREVCGTVGVPVLAIGGVTVENAGDCIRAGAAGIAAIRMFQTGKTRSVIEALRKI